MDAIPSRPLGERAQITGVACPDCPGVLEVSAEHGHLRFRCRIGHVYSLAELIEGKERRIEDRLLAPVTALDELATLLREIVATGRANGAPEAFEARAERALRHARMIRSIIEENEPTPLENPKVLPRGR